MRTVDLNCDMGEAFGPWQMGNDAELIKHVSSINVACGFHAGDPSTMRKTVALAIENGVAIGAHPGYPDLQGFGRREWKMASDEVRDIVVYQVAALKGICEAAGAELHHVKPHGALYNQAAKNPELARAIAHAVKMLNADLILYGLAGSFLISEGSACGLRTASEAFADRTYQADGNLTPRTQTNALITGTTAAVRQALSMIEVGKADTVSGESVKIRADTICIHGDGEHAVEFAQALNVSLAERSITVAAP